jgi:RHS repeat-associated protein
MQFAIDVQAIAVHRTDASSSRRRRRSALGRARRAWAPRPALRATIARRPEAAEHDRPCHAALRGSRPHTDHLGSTDTISDSSGGVTTQRFDPFGAPVDPPSPELTRVGFTGQDQDVDLGLTDMKGRIYDPVAGRFTSPDPVMQAPFCSQGLNFDSQGAGLTEWAVGSSALIVGGAAIEAFSPSFGSALVGALGSGANPAAGLIGGDRHPGTPANQLTAVPKDMRRKGESLVALIHSHPFDPDVGGNELSDADVDWARQNHVTIYATGSDWSIRAFDPTTNTITEFQPESWR